MLKAIQGIEILIDKSNQTSNSVTLLTEFCRLVQLKDPQDGTTEAIHKTEALLHGISDLQVKGKMLIQLSVLYESRDKVGDLSQAVRVLGNIKSTNTDYGFSKAVEERLAALRAKMSQTSV